tara:strand:- start:57 stop:350 length:294 start_codon:yes stop_codon:yes gene_type:complete
VESAESWETNFGCDDFGGFDFDDFGFGFGFDGFGGVGFDDFGFGFGVRTDLGGLDVGIFGRACLSCFWGVGAGLFGGSLLFFGMYYYNVYFYCFVHS